MLASPPEVQTEPLLQPLILVNPGTEVVLGLVAGVGFVATTGVDVAGWVGVVCVNTGVVVVVGACVVGVTAGWEETGVVFTGVDGAVDVWVSPGVTLGVDVVIGEGVSVGALNVSGTGSDVETTGFAAGIAAISLLKLEPEVEPPPPPTFSAPLMLPLMEFNPLPTELPR